MKRNSAASQTTTGGGRLGALPPSLRVLLAWLAFAATVVAGTPWDDYNAGVNAYSAQQYTEAEQLWQELARSDLPRSLRQPVWFQIGNAEFRLGESLTASTPEQAVELWRRSCAAYRSVLGLNARHAEARHNLAFVERRLASLTQQLGNQLRAQAERQSLDEAIAQLRPAADLLREAQQLAPDDAGIRRDRAAVEQRLQARLAERAQQSEQRGDQSATQKNTWADEQAEKAYREALSDLEEAQRQAPAAAAAAARELTTKQQRVEQKLADLLTRMGQREQKTAAEQASYNPDEAMGSYETALEKFQAAQAVKPEHAAAQLGEQQVKAAMEQLHMREGKQAQAAGEQAAPNSPARAARELTAALSHFEAALAINPQNGEAESRAAQVRKQLPDLLTRAGQAEQQAGEKTEKQDANDARSHYEEAQSEFQGALELAPGHQPAQAGLAQVEQRLARLRQQQAEKAAQARQNQPGKPQDLQQLLGQVKESRRNDRETERQRQAARNQPTPRRVYPDW